MGGERGAVGLLPGGTLLGRYELIRLLSVGGMAEIYLARAEGIAGFEKRVVIKRMLPHFAVQPDYVRMFLDEARLAACLDHPNIVQVHDIGEETGNYHYAMEYIRGGDLRDLLRSAARTRSPVPMGSAVAIALGLCSGLDFAHSLAGADGLPLGVVHRDVSLSNVLVSFDGAVKVTDFGVAKMSQSDHRTRTGTLKGKVAYMSPEQCRGKPLDRRSDVFAAGIILHELITGRRLFGGTGQELAMLQRIVYEDAPPPSRSRAECPPALDEIVARALRRDRNERYQTAREMQRDLEALARSERLAISSIELGDYMNRLLGSQEAALAPVVLPLAAAATAPELETEWSSGGGDGDDGDDDDDGHVSVDVVEGAESRPATATPDRTLTRRSRALGRPVPRPTVASHLRSALLALGVAALATAGLLEQRDRSPSRPAAVAAVDVHDRGPPPQTPAPPSVAVPDSPAMARAAPAEAIPPPPTPPPADPAHPDMLAPPTQPSPLTEPTAAPPARERAARGSEPPRLAQDIVRRQPRPREARPEPIAAISRDPMPEPRPEPPAAAPPPIDAGTPPLDAAPHLTPIRRAPAPAAAPPVGSLDATPSLRSIDVTGPLQESEIRRALERVLPALRTCYREAAQKARRTPRAEVRVGLEIDDNRAARGVRAASAPLPGLSSCISSAVARTRTRIAPDVGNASVVVVITFTPTGP